MILPVWAIVIVLLACLITRVLLEAGESTAPYKELSRVENCQVKFENIVEDSSIVCPNGQTYTRMIQLLNDSDSLAGDNKKRVEFVMMHGILDPNHLRFTVKTVAKRRHDRVQYIATPVLLPGAKKL